MTQLEILGLKDLLLELGTNVCKGLWIKLLDSLDSHRFPVCNGNGVLEPGNRKQKIDEIGTI